ncbi:MAG TPA: hypothetical protein PKI11_07145 [Candidatus Hydrogenedentes bacterium]|nr:hypothetical protein [Candidatus Hydrogenedentota bacterium]HNT89209.1 hypothetical protein [Candidatus Hydrogenedentota bacterium]
MSTPNPYEDRTECVGTCIVCDPNCPVHELRARERAAGEAAFSSPRLNWIHEPDSELS